MFTYLRELLGSQYAPHGYCLLWQPGLVWTHVVADTLIAAAYFSIPIALVHFVRRRKDLVFGRMFWLFALFITACGATHVMAIWTLWHGDYGLEAAVKIITAMASVPTAIILWPLIPKALALPSPVELRAANEELAQRIRERDAALTSLQEEAAQRQKAESALVQAQKMEAVGQLTGGIAHDFNNILQAVSGNLELMQRQPGNVEKIERWAGNAQAALARGTRLTAQLLAFSRTQQLELRPIALNELMANMLEMLTRTLGPGIHVRTNIEPGETGVLADRTQLELALLNLAINARDAMPDRGSLIITASRRWVGRAGELAPGEYVDIAVADTGCGMDEDVVAKAFDPFFTTKPVGQGTGLGLSMVFGVARQCGGNVAIQSQPGSGTTVTITLPRVDPPATGIAAESAPYVQPDVGALTEAIVLIVDDDDEVREATVNALENYGCRVIDAPDGPAALALLERHEPDCVVLDFAMPHMNGAELARLIRRKRPDAPIIFASGYADSHALEAAIGTTAPVLRKPFVFSDLAEMVATQVKGRKRD